MRKKTVTKDDGRILIYYHFPDSASAEQTSAFESVVDGERLAPPHAPGAIQPITEPPAGSHKE